MNLSFNIQKILNTTWFSDFSLLKTLSLHFHNSEGVICQIRKPISKLYILLIFLIAVSSMTAKVAPDIFIRLNQIGYLPDEYKSGIVLSNQDLNNKIFYIISALTSKIVLSGKLNSHSSGYAKFDYAYQIEFSALNKNGEYYVEINGIKSLNFSIKDKLFSPIVKNLLKFFQVQRCGYTNPILHKECHIADATAIIDGAGNRLPKMDVTGGWHDAGDYIKFLNTTAFATYTLLFSYDFDPVKFGFDSDGNNIPDILEEAKIGLDWLLRANYKNEKLVTQVQDLRDHDQEWRLPENDKLTFDRPAFLGIGKNLIGIYSAALALGSKIWKEKFDYSAFSEKCLNTAVSFYDLRNNVADIDSSGTGMYIDKLFYGKLALGAIELYNLTKKTKYYNEAVKYGNLAGSDYWWSWGDINTFADYRIAKLSTSIKIKHNFTDKIQENLRRFQKISNSKLFGEGVALYWGSNNTILGITLQNILWKSLSHKSLFDTLAVTQRDYILGRNPWGISFIWKTGTNFTKSFHSQIAYFNNGKLPGGFAAGPVNKAILDSSGIKFETIDKYFRFQTDDSYYRDDRMDYISNEPTITANATAIFVMGYFQNTIKLKKNE